MKPAAVFKQLSIIHIAICLGTCIIVGILYTLKMQANEVVSSENRMNILYRKKKNKSSTKRK